MPIYEYKCERCGKLFEVMQKFADTPLTTHEECGGHVDRLLSAPALQFKGSGWYITDYAKSGSTGAPNGPASSSEGGGDKPADKKDSSSTASGSSEKTSTPATESKTSSTPDTKS